MKTYLDCIPCFYRQAIETSRRAGLSEEKIKRIINKTAKIIAAIKHEQSPPEVAGIVNDYIMKKSGCSDVYTEAKQQSNDLALKVYDDCKKIIFESNDRLCSAVEFAIAGNIIDYGAKHDIDVEKEVSEIIQNQKNLVCGGNRDYFAYAEFKAHVSSSRKILYLGDNAGETVFDRILLETIISESPGIEIVYAVKDRPVLNDAVLSDALYCGLDSVATLISSGSRLPGTVAAKCSKQFMEHYITADIIISKGQGNFESFSAPDKNVFYLFMAKCVMVARDVGCDIGTFNLHYTPALSRKRERIS